MCHTALDWQQGLLWFCLVACGSGIQLHASPDIDAILRHQAAWVVLGIQSYVRPVWMAGPGEGHEPAPA